MKSLSCIILTIWHSEKDKITETIKELVVVRVSRREEEGWIDGALGIYRAVKLIFMILSVQFSSVQSLKSCPTLCDSINCSTPGLPVYHQLLEFTQTHLHWVSDAIQQSHPLLSPSPPTLNLSQHQGLFKWVNSSHQVASVLEFQLQHQSFQWILRVDFL